MANFKRGRPKKQRAGCLFCKPHKGNGMDRRTHQEVAADISFDESVSEALGHDPWWWFLEDDDDGPCDCSECVYWRESLEASSAHLARPLTRRLLP